jgi:hypothetical protein
MHRITHVGNQGKKVCEIEVKVDENIMAEEKTCEVGAVGREVRLRGLEAEKMKVEEERLEIILPKEKKECAQVSRSTSVQKRRGGFSYVLH